MITFSFKLMVEYKYAANDEEISESNGEQLFCFVQPLVRLMVFSLMR